MFIDDSQNVAAAMKCTTQRENLDFKRYVKVEVNFSSLLKP